MRFASQIALGSVRHSQLQPQRLSQQPFPSAMQTTKGYHRRLIEVAIIIIVLGAVFLLFWQGVIRFGIGPSTWNEDYCRRLLSQYEPSVMTENLAEVRDTEFSLSGVFADGAKFVNIRGAGDVVDTCAIRISSVQPVSSGFGDGYACNISTVSYKSEEQNDWKLIGVQTMISEDFAELVPYRYTTLLVYYNPDSDTGVAEFNADFANLAGHSCAV